jgi:hypothetical protein
MQILISSAFSYPVPEHSTHIRQSVLAFGLMREPKALASHVRICAGGRMPYTTFQAMYGRALHPQQIIDGRPDLLCPGVL